MRSSFNHLAASKPSISDGGDILLASEKVPAWKCQCVLSDLIVTTFLVINLMIFIKILNYWCCSYVATEPWLKNKQENPPESTAVMLSMWWSQAVNKLAVFKCMACGCCMCIWRENLIQLLDMKIWPRKPPFNDPRMFRRKPKIPSQVSWNTPKGD